MPSRRTFNAWAGAALLAASIWHPALAADTKAEMPKQKGTLVFAVELARGADPRPDPRRPARQRRLSGGDVRLAGRVRH